MLECFVLYLYLLLVFEELIDVLRSLLLIFVLGFVERFPEHVNLLHAFLVLLQTVLVNLDARLRKLLLESAS